MKKRQITVIVITFSILLIGYLTMLFLISQRSAAERRQPIILDKYVKAEKINYKTIVSPVIATGRLVSSQIIDLTSEASGKIEEGAIFFKKGESFKKGDILVKIYDDENRLALKAKKSKFLNSLALILPDIKIDFPSQYNKYYNFLSSIELDKDIPSLPDISDNKMKIYLASRNILSDYYSIKGDELHLKRFVIRAPFDGALLLVNQEVGSFAGVGTRLAKIINTSKLELEVSVNDSKSKWIEIGDKVKITMESCANDIEGVVIRKSNFIDENTQSRTIYVKIIKGINKIVWGHYMTAEFEGKGIKGVMEIPRNAVFNNNQVFVVIDSTLRKSNINIIKQNNTSILFNGLDENIDIVTEPLLDTRENIKVKILK